MATIAVLGTMDTKGEEHAFVAELIRQSGHTPLIIDVGTLEPPKVKPDVTREEVAKAAGADYVKTSTGFGPGGATVAAGATRVGASAGVKIVQQSRGPFDGLRAGGESAALPTTLPPPPKY